MKSRTFVLLLVGLPLLCLSQENGSLCVKANTGRAGVFVDGKYLGPAATFPSRGHIRLRLATTR